MTLVVVVAGLVGQNEMIITNSEEMPVRTQEALIKAANKTEPAIVSIYGTKVESGISQNGDWFRLSMPAVSKTMGTGFIISTDGKIMTNKHVVEDTRARYRVVTSSGDRYAVSNIYRDPSNDIAIVVIDPNQHQDNKLTAISLGDSSQIKSGQLVTTVATAPSSGEMVKTGTIDGIRHSVVAGDNYQNSAERLSDVIQTSLDLVPGNSGSPLLDESGKVIGINTAAAADGESIGFAIPIEPAKKFLQSIATCSC